MENSIIKLLSEKIEKIKNDNSRTEEQRKKIDYYSNMIIDDTKSINIEEFSKFILDIGVELNEDEVSKLDSLVTLAIGIDLGIDFELTKDQIGYLELIRNNIVLQKGKLSRISFKKYEDLFNKLTKFDNNEFVMEFDIITDLLKESKISDLEKIDVWKKLILFNQKVYNNQTNGDDYEDDNNIEYTDLDDSKLNEILSKYNIDFDMFDKEEKKLLLMFGNLENIDSILNCLSNNDLLRKNNNIIIDDVKLVNLLVYSNESIINDVFNKADEYGIKKTRIFELVNVFIAKKRNGERISRKYYAREHKILNAKYGARIYGSYESYCDNLKLFKQYGIDVKTVANKFVALLGASTFTIRKNLNLFNLYGITVDVSDYNSKVGVAPVSINRVNLFDNIDHMLEFGASDARNMSYSTIAFMDDEYIRKTYNAYKNGKQIFKYVSNSNRTWISKVNIMDPINHFCINKDDEACGFDFEHKKEMDSVINYLSNDNVREDIIKDINISYLENNNKANDYTYRINGVLISRYKVLRIYSSLKNNNITNENALLYAVTYNSLLSKDDFDKVKGGLVPVVKHERRID